MRILVLGAGAVGGYFGGRLLEKGEDVTFLVREKRQKELKERGLIIQSIHGDVTLQPKTILSEENVEPYDLIIFATKAYHLHTAIEAIKPYVGEASLILPLLNGYEHFDVLREAFGDERVLGGLCFIEATLNEKGDVIQTSPIHQLAFGDLSGGLSPRMEILNEVLSNTKATFRLSENILQDIWHKYLFITTLSGITTLMRSPIGPIRDTAGGIDFIEQLLKETSSIINAENSFMAKDIIEKHLETIKKQAPTMKASMLRDMEKSAPTEADHLQGYLLQLAKAHNIQVPLLQLVYHNLKVYELNKD